MPSPSTLMTTLLAVAGIASAGEFTGCTDKNYKGVCGKWSASHDTCITLIGNHDWDNKLSSIYVGPAGAAVTCYIYDGPNCEGPDRGGPITPSNPHADLGAVRWGDKVTSFKCNP